MTFRRQKFLANVFRLYYARKVEVSPSIETLASREENIEIMKVLIIGGGFGGLTACTSIRKFDKKVELVLVEPKEYFEVAWASYRAMFDEDVAKKACYELKKWALPKSVTHIKATVTKLEGLSATLSTGDVVTFDVCVIAVGAATRWPALGRGPPLPGHDGTMQRRLEILDREGKKLLSKNSVLIVGGGLIGVEVAGDLASYASKEDKEIDITLVHAKGQLCPEFNEKAAFIAKAKLESLGVKVILNEKVVKRENDLFFESKNEKVTAMHVLWTTGLNSINKFIADKSLLDRRGWLQTDDYFRVKGMENKYFAIGDCCDLLPNSAARIMDNIGVIGKNVKAVLDGIEAGSQQGVESKMRLALGKAEVFVATAGPTTGVAQTSCLTTQFFLPWLKNSTMFLFKPKMDFGLKS